MGMQSQLSASRTMSRSELESCALVTKLPPAHDPASGPKHYEGFLVLDLRVGLPLILSLDGRKRLVTSRIRKLRPLAAGLFMVETGNSYYTVKTLLPESLVETEVEASSA